jgi:hypothetical protein
MYAIFIQYRICWEIHDILFLYANAISYLVLSKGNLFQEDENISLCGGKNFIAMGTAAWL